MKVIVAGGGNIGRYLAADLAGRGHDVALVERDDVALGRAVGERVTGVLGDACSPSVLEHAGARAADVVVAATGDDEDNLVISLLAKQEFAVPHVLARVNHPTNEWLFDDLWGVDQAVSPPHLLTAMVEEAVTEGDVVPLLKLEHGAAELLEVRLDAHSAAVGQCAGDIDLPAGCVLAAVIRDGRVVPIRDTTPLAEGDEVFAVVEAGGDAHDGLRRLLIGNSRARGSEAGGSQAGAQA